MPPPSQIPPLQTPPSRARRQFAARLAQRKALMEASAKETDEGVDENEPTESNNKEAGSIHSAKGIGKYGSRAHERFSNLLQGIDDSSSSSSGSDDQEVGENKSDQGRDVVGQTSV
ncbi:hypothetical protein GQ43DRAFT_472817 [Delitschia confertaspora ATCC 74209]|uniref:Uncharacterized protein n=1 Tax=Delitschia confertaspora ATCC 74209 TaxID=1513339 RepID=A0A9P4JJ42_9PLEO|nr:hypothetical protein GQ43DRAFT_472817 [Delitschia confertaspora ATCC 74209]